MYRSLNSSLVDTERLMMLLEEPTEVNDKPGAPDLIVDDGEIEFGTFLLTMVYACVMRHVRGSTHVWYSFAFSGFLLPFHLEILQNNR